MKLKWTTKLPSKEGYYWWTNFGEHTPTILYVKKEGRKWYASNEEFSLQVERVKPRKLEENETFVEDKFKHGDELWCYIPNPTLPSGKETTHDSY